MWRGYRRGTGAVEAVALQNSFLRVVRSLNTPFAARSLSCCFGRVNPNNHFNHLHPRLHLHLHHSFRYYYSPSPTPSSSCSNTPAVHIQYNNNLDRIGNLNHRLYLPFAERVFSPYKTDTNINYPFFDEPRTTTTSTLSQLTPPPVLPPNFFSFASSLPSAYPDIATMFRPPAGNGPPKQSTLSFSNKPLPKPSLKSLTSRPGPAKPLPPSGLNSLPSRTPSVPSVPPTKQPVQRVASSLGKRHAGSQEALRQALQSENSFADEPAKIEDDKAPRTAKDALKQAVYWEEDDFEFDDMDLVELGLSNSSSSCKPANQTSNIIIPPKKTQFNPKLETAPSSSANEWQKQFKMSPEASTKAKDVTSIQKQQQQQPSEPASKKRRTLPWQAKEEAEKKAREAAELAAILTVEKYQTPQSAKTTSSLPWDKTASAVKAAKLDLKGKLQQKRALSTASLGGQGGARGQKPTRHYMSNEQSHVLDMVVNEGKSVFFTGSAGTGKSVLLREIITGLRKKHKNYDSVAITASTGLAACNIGGVTLHSFSGIGLGREPVEQLVKKIRRVPKSKQRWLRTKVLIIDEISMVDGDLFDKLEGVARTLKNNGRPFGGIQLVVTGDFFQLPPVPDNGRMAKFAFEANTWANCVDHTILLTHIFRQKDPVFAAMLNEMRLGMLSPASVANFKKLNRKLQFDDGLQATELFPTRREVDNANNAQLRTLKTASEVYTAQDESAILDAQQREKLLSNCMAPQTLELKVGAQVMLVKNMDETLVNGSLGRIISFVSEKTFNMAEESGTADVIFGSQDGEEYGIMSRDQKAIFERYSNEQSNTSTAKKYPLVQWSIADGTQRRTLVLPEAWKFELPTGEVQASRKQVPLILAWALSIHKAQGQTLDRVKVDLNKVFEKGQAYVALSRATTQEGLQVLNFDARKVMAHDKVRAFYKSLTSAEAAAAGTSVSAANNTVGKVDDEDDGFPDDDELEELHGAAATTKLRQFAYS
ncbi:hypothetical protein TWF694_011916 [Orbilia ellipsospora]|uniref:ATP-dependent DNA helicase PIF1 n=1 Tax=Orbilia ellipsospora TaxID=2528407 RepID=A0AAV9X1R8_9PEZI